MKFERLKLLFDYTKFHIGLYTTLLTGLLALMTLGSNKVPEHFHKAILVTVVCFALAGAAGGVIASNIPKFSSIDCFREHPIGPWGCEWFSGKKWASLEHLFFWIGVLWAILVVGYYFLNQSPSPLEIYGGTA